MSNQGNKYQRKEYSHPKSNQKEEREKRREQYRTSITKAFGEKDFPTCISFILNNEKDTTTLQKYMPNIQGYVEKSAHQWTTSQLRNVFSRIKAIRDTASLHRLRPQIAYTSGRTQIRELQELLFFFDELIQNVQSEASLQEFKFFVESVIAYHKYFGGQD